MNRKRPLDPHAARHLANGEAAAQAAAADVRHDALEDLGTLLLSLDDADVDPDRVAGPEIHRPVGFEPGFEPLHRSHDSSSSCPLWIESKSFRSSSLNGRSRSRSGRRRYVRLSASLRFQRRMRSWFPPRSTSGTASP